MFHYGAYRLIGVFSLNDVPAIIQGSYMPNICPPAQSISPENGWHLFSWPIPDNENQNLTQIKLEKRASPLQRW